LPKLDSRGNEVSENKRPIDVFLSILDPIDVLVEKLKQLKKSNSELYVEAWNKLPNVTRENVLSYLRSSNVRGFDTVSNEPAPLDEGNIRGPSVRRRETARTQRVVVSLGVLAFGSILVLIGSSNAFGFLVFGLAMFMGGALGLISADYKLRSLFETSVSTRVIGALALLFMGSYLFAGGLSNAFLLPLQVSVAGLSGPVAQAQVQTVQNQIIIQLTFGLACLAGSLLVSFLKLENLKPPFAQVSAYGASIPRAPRPSMLSIEEPTRELKERTPRTEKSSFSTPSED